jgi:hypothetical protein
MLLLTLFNSVHVWKVVFPHVMQVWQWSIEGQVCAWPGEMRCYHLEINLEQVAFGM